MTTGTSFHERTVWPLKATCVFLEFTAVVSHHFPNNNFRNANFKSGCGRAGQKQYRVGVLERS